MSSVKKFYNKNANLAEGSPSLVAVARHMAFASSLKQKLFKFVKIFLNKKFKTENNQSTKAKFRYR